MDFIESETDISLIDDDNSDYDDDDELYDVKSNKSREDNEMNEVYQVAHKTHSALQLWRYASLFILVGTFVAILTSIFMIINSEHQDDDEEAVSGVYCVYVSASHEVF